MSVLQFSLSQNEKQVQIVLYSLFIAINKNLLNVHAHSASKDSFTASVVNFVTMNHV